MIQREITNLLLKSDTSLLRLTEEVRHLLPEWFGQSPKVQSTESLPLLPNMC